MPLEMGLCVTPDFLPPPNKAPFYRSIIYSVSDLFKLKATNKPIMLTLNNQCREVGSDWKGWSYTVNQVVSVLGPQLLVLNCGNEFDIYWDRNPSDCPPEFAALLCRLARETSPHTKITSTSLAGPRWISYLSAMVPLVTPYVDYIDLHPYGQKPDNWGTPGWGVGNLRDAIVTAQKLSNKPVLCSEYGVKIADAGGLKDQASFLSAAHETLNSLEVPFCSWFAWTDAVGTVDEQGQQAFGLIDTEGNPRPAWQAYLDRQPDTSDHQPKNGTSVSPLDAWRNSVGAGLLEMMRQDGTVPAMASEWRPFDRPPGTPAVIEQCIGENCVTYCWNIRNGVGWRIWPNRALA